MSIPEPSRSLKLFGTEQPDVRGKQLRAGNVSLEFENGDLRFLKINSVEVIHSIAFVVHDEGWQRITPVLSRAKLEPRGEGFRLSFRADLTRNARQLMYEVMIDGKSDGTVIYKIAAQARSDFPVNRAGFVVLCPARACAGRPVEIELEDGDTRKEKYPENIPAQPWYAKVRAASIEAAPGYWSTIRLDGELLEIEDNRNWGEAYVQLAARSLAQPWPYVLRAESTFEQVLTFSYRGSMPNPPKLTRSPSLEVKLGDALRRTMPRMGLAVAADEADFALKHAELLKVAGTKFFACQFDPRLKHGASQLAKYRHLSQATGAELVLDVVVEKADGYADEFARLASLLQAAELKPESIALTPANNLKASFGATPRNQQPPLKEFYAAARKALPGIRLGGGNAFHFAQLNRRRPATQSVDYLFHGLGGIVHYADDRSLMDSVEALTYQVETLRAFAGEHANSVGPCAMGLSDNPFGAALNANPKNERMVLTRADPRQRGIYGAAWTLAVFAALAKAGVSAITMHAAGQLGIVHRRGQQLLPWYDELDRYAVYPAFHIFAGFAKMAGAPLLGADSTSPNQVAGFAYRTAHGSRLWVVNLTADPQPVELKGLPAGYATVRILDEDNFVTACAPGAGKNMVRMLTGRHVKLKAYGIACVDCA